MTRASTHSSALRWSAIAQPTISRVPMSLIAARYRKPSPVGIYEMSASQTWSGLSAVKFRASRFGGDRQVVAAVRGAGDAAAAPAGREPHLAHHPFDAPARMPPAVPAQLGVDPRRAVDPLAGGEEAAGPPAQLGFRLGPGLDGGDRAQPGVEAGHARADHPAQRGHGVVRPLGRHEAEPRHAIPLAKTAAALQDQVL